MKAALHNLGCKTNSYETEAMEQALKAAGFEIVTFAGEVPADVYIVNTCSVTNIADRKSRQMLHKARTLNPAAVIVAVGCFVQTSKKSDLEREGFDICLGSNDKGKLIESIQDFLKDGIRRITVSDLKKKTDYETLPVNETPKHTRAFIKIEDGCDQFCTFCIIPYARGRVRSRKIPDVLEEVRRLTAGGIKEIVLTGINMSAYGTDLDSGVGIADLLLALQEVSELTRVRISSLEPGLVSSEFLEKIKPVTKLCPHFHLSLQSGSDGVLKRMNRRYTCDEYLSKCDMLRKYYDRPSITTDIITGFPEETDEEFAQTLRFVEKVGFFDIHVFAFSPRSGTPAANMPGQVEGKVKRLRSALLIQKAAQLKRKCLETFVGTTDEVLIEELWKGALPAEYMPGGCDAFYVGHTRRYIKVLVAINKEGLEGRMVSVKLEEIVSVAGEDYIIGRLL